MSNAASPIDAPAAAGAPTQHIVLLQALGNAPARLAAELAPLGEAGAGWRPAPGEWSAVETVTHLAAAEPPFLARLEHIAAEDNPFLPYFGPEVAAPDASRPLPEALADFRAGRERLLAFLAGLPPAAWHRPAVHQTLGPTTLALQVQNILNHDREHLAQLQRTVQAWPNHAHA